jgi:DNA-binding SARP family transcriptional activator
MSLVEFRILGRLELYEEGRRLPLGAAKQRALLAILLLHANELVPADRLAEELWSGEPPPSAPHLVHVYVSELRKTLHRGPREVLLTRPPGYVLVIDPDSLDLHRFEQLFSQARHALDAGDAATASSMLADALDLWSGPPLADFTYESFAQAAIGRLEELRLAAQELSMEADLALGRHLELIPDLHALSAAHPLREHLRAQLMLALYRSGRQAEALAVYQDARQALVDELGIEPSPALQELEGAILRQDPALKATPPIRPVQPERSRKPERSLLVAAERTDCLEALLALADPLARKPPREVILAQLVTDADMLAEATRLVSDWKTALVKHDLIVRAAAFTSSDPGEDLVRLATEQEVDLLLVDAPTEFLAEGLPDHRLEAVLTGAPCDVGVLVPRAPSDMNRSVLVPFGGDDNDWAAVELGAWIASALGRSLTLTGTVADRGSGRRDASRLLASVSLMVQQVTGLAVEPLLVEPGAAAVIEAANDASLLVVGLSGGWRQHGLGSARLAVARDARPPTLFVRGGLRPGGLAPKETFTRFTWTLAGADSP